MTKLEKEIEVSRTASDYEASGHLKQRLRRGGSRKVLDYDIIAEAIEEGDVVAVDEQPEESGPALTISHEWCMTTFEVVIAPVDLTVQTAYEVES